MDDGCFDVNVDPATISLTVVTLDQRLVFTMDELNVVKRAVDTFLGVCFSKDLS